MADMTEIQKNLANTMAKDEGARMADFMGNPAAYLTGLGISFQSLPPQAQEAFQSLAAGDISAMEAVWPEINNIVSEKAKQMQEEKSTPSYSVNQEAANNASTISLGAQMPQDKSQITIPAPTLDAGNVISEKQGTSPYTVNQDALANAPTVSVKAQTPQANDQISVPAPTLDAGKVLSVTPEMPKDETQITIPAPTLDAGKVISSAPEKQNQSEQPSVEAVPEAQAGKKPLNFKDGFELSEAAKKKLRENDKGLWGIAEDFASAQEPEDAFMAAFVGLLLYLPNKAMAKLDEMEVRREEMKAHIEKQAQAHDDFVAHGLGMGAADRFMAIHKEIVEGFGDMAKVAANLKEKNPELLKGLGLDFDENGQLKGKLKDKQIKELTDRIIANNFMKNFGHLPTKEQLEESQKRVDMGLKSGLYAQVALSRGLSPEMPKDANPQEVLNALTPQNVAQSNQASEASPAPATENTPVENTVEAPTATLNAPQTEDVADKPATTENLAAPSTYSIAEEGMNVIAQNITEDETTNISDAIKQVNAEELPERKPANLQKVQETFSVSSETNFADAVQNFSVSYSQVKEDEKQVAQNRDNLNRAKQGPAQEIQAPAYTLNRGYQYA